MSEAENIVFAAFLLALRFEIKVTISELVEQLQRVEWSSLLNLRDARVPALGIPRKLKHHSPVLDLWAWLTDPRVDVGNFRRFTRLERDEFELLLQATQRRINGPFYEVHHGQYVDSGAPKARRMTARNMLILFLYQMSSTGMQQYRIAKSVGLSPATVSRYFYHVLHSVYYTLAEDRPIIRWPTKQERAMLARKLIGFEGVIGFVDGTRTRTRKPSIGGLEKYSGKTHTYCSNHQVVCDLHGNIIHVVVGYSGSTHDVTIWKNSELSMNGKSFFSPGEKLMGDPGYLGQNEPNLVTTPREIDVQKDQDLRRQANMSRKHRILIEYVIGRVKKSWPLPGCSEGSTYQRNEAFHRPALHVAFQLQQFIFDVRGQALRTQRYFDGQAERWEHQLKVELQARKTLAGYADKYWE